MAWSWHWGHIKGPLQGEMSTLKWHFYSPSPPENNLNHQHHVWLLRKLLWRPRLWKLRLWRPGLWLWLLLRLWLPQAGLWLWLWLWLWLPLSLWLWLWMRLGLWFWLLLLRTHGRLSSSTPGHQDSPVLNEPHIFFILLKTCLLVPSASDTPTLPFLHLMSKEWKNVKFIWEL